MDRLHEVTAKAKEVLCQAMKREKSLSLSRRGKAVHMIFLLSRRLMRHFDAVVGVGIIDVLDRGHHDSVRGVIAFKFVSQHPARFTALAFEQATKDAHGRVSVEENTATSDL